MDVNDIYGERYVWDPKEGKMTKIRCRVLVQSEGVNNKRYKFVDAKDAKKHWNAIESRLGQVSENHLSLYFLGEGHTEEAFAAFRLYYAKKRKFYRRGLDEVRAALNTLEMARVVKI